ncbi:MFS general substrate transporter [Plenodomus tracheiphilus IPT5]|uniref:MFS general substrate transporter n=1 Tax=Plenodomus tracheiphilus IPT5 TaxID=1408161 RepID=A0A6A7BKM5_9PLEO|nr:MFS general substrate transporter [Plenodomus tracheiphilus IPT5]
MSHTRSIQRSHETTPLLTEVAPEPLAPGEADGIAGNRIDEENEEDRPEVPLPKTQIFLLCFTSISGPIAFFSIFPYINFMIENIGNVEKEDVGFYSGLIESLFSATQMCVMILWGRASDRFGRKPVLVLSLLGMSAATTLFGMSSSLWQMVVFRCTAGVFAGTVVTVRAMFSEISTKQTQARAFSFFSFAYNLGIFIGPLIGGALESPADKYPSLFGQIQFFQKYPYALPNIVISGIAFITALTTIFFVKETLHIHHDRKATDEPPMSSWQLIRRPGVTPVLLVYNYVMLLAFTLTAVFPVFQYTPVDLGGLGFSPAIIAACTGLNGASQAIWLLLAFPKLHRRFGTGRILWFCAIAWPIFFAMCPMYHFLLAYGYKILFWSTGPPMLVLGSGVAMAFTGIQLALNDIAPSHETLGTLNAIALAAQSGLRAVAPAAATSVYAIGVKYNILGGQLFWLCNVVLAVGLLWLLRVLPEKAKGVVKRKQSARV